MKLVTTALALVLLAAPSFAATPLWSNHDDMHATIQQKNMHLSGNLPEYIPHASGDNVGNALPIASLPFSDVGNTCGYADDYDIVCPYSGSTSPDAVYAYTAPANMGIDIDLCDSQYDTKVYVFDGSPSTVIACNDDAGCGITGYQSKLTNVQLVGGHTYYIVVDGYGGDCGDYYLNINEHTNCAACLVPAQAEGELDCYDGTVDNYNAGCNTTPAVFTPVTCGEICGTTGTFVTDGGSFRDTDWYEITVGAGTFTLSGIGDGFNLQLLVIAPSCPATVLYSTVANACETGSVSFPGPGTYYLWAGPNAFSGVPCGSNYHLTIDGPGIDQCGATPTRRSSWGQLKSIYR